jgi:hypothetical protein
MDGASQLTPPERTILLMAVWGVPLYFFFAWADKKVVGSYRWRKNALLILIGLIGGAAIGYVLVYWMNFR